MNVAQLEATRSRKFTPSSRRPRLVSAIPQIPIIVSHKQHIRSIMPQTTIVTCKLGQKVEPSRRNQSKNGQATYQVLVNIQVGRRAYQINEDPSQVTIPFQH
jgi:hypothetical protein